ncbi:metallophosphoesterase family protein [bacterium]|nr:metallophosphoesterase family protein [bacterium]
MRVALISDVHSNLEALEAVLKDIRSTGVDEIYSLGDVVGYGADPAACLDLVQSACKIMLRGNHESALLDSSRKADMATNAVQAINWTRSQLSSRELSLMASWPVVSVGSDARLVHASPDHPGEFQYLKSRWDMENAFKSFSEQICFYGHTHQPAAAEEIIPGAIRILPPRSFILDAKCRYLVNVGSVGQPRNRDTTACWVLVTNHPPEVGFNSVAYDIRSAQEKILKAGLPSILAKRLAEGV